MSDTNATPKKTPTKKNDVDDTVIVGSPEVAPREVDVDDADVVVVDDTSSSGDHALVTDHTSTADRTSTADHSAAADHTVTDDTVVVDGTAAASDDVLPVSETVATGEVTPVVATSATDDEVPVAHAVQTVYVTAPTPPNAKGNRGIATLLAFVAAIVFAIVYAGIAIVLILVIDASVAPVAISGFFVNSLFYVPVLVFLVSMILWALLANRAGWWSWIIGSLVIAALTYFASIGILLLLLGGFGLTSSAATAAFVALATNPALIVAALVARECAIWFGAAIAKRGRKVRERNYATWQAFENEQAQKRAEFGGEAAS